MLRKAKEKAMELKDLKGSELAEVGIARVREILAAFNASRLPCPRRRHESRHEEPQVQFSA